MPPGPGEILVVDVDLDLVAAVSAQVAERRAEHVVIGLPAPLEAKPVLRGGPDKVAVIRQLRDPGIAVEQGKTACEIDRLHRFDKVHDLRRGLLAGLRREIPGLEMVAMKIDDLANFKRPQLLGNRGDNRHE